MELCNRSNRTESEELIKALFNNLAFGGFSFDMFFTLRFYRNGEGQFKDKTLPREIEIQILSEWWFGKKNEWVRRVKQLTTYKLVEPDEPVLAYELACIRWTEGSEVTLIDFDNDTMIIHFRCGKSIVITLESEDDYAWIIQETNNSEPRINLSIVCNDGEFYVNF